MEDYYGIKSRRAREYIRSLPFKKKIPMKAMFPKTSDLALDLLEKLLAFNPVKRITVEEALRHPYLEPYHDPEDEPTAEAIPEAFFDFDKNKDNLTKEELKRKLSIFPLCMQHPRLTESRIDIPRDHAINVLCNPNSENIDWVNHRLDIKARTPHMPSLANTSIFFGWARLIEACLLTYLSESCISGGGAGYLQTFLYLEASIGGCIYEEWILTFFSPISRLYESGLFVHGAC